MLQKELESERSQRAALEKCVRKLVRECDEAHEECEAYVRRLRRCEKKLRLAQEREATGSISTIELQAEIDRLKSSQNGSILSQKIAEESLKCDRVSKKCANLEAFVSAKQDLLDEKIAECQSVRTKLAATEEDLTSVRQKLDACETSRVEPERNLSEKHCVDVVSLKAEITDLRLQCERNTESKKSLEAMIQSVKHENHELHEARVARETDFRSHIESMTNAWVRAQQAFSDQSEALVSTTESRLKSLSNKTSELRRLLSELSQKCDAQRSEINDKRHELETLSAVVRKQAQEKNVHSTEAFRLKKHVERYTVQLRDMSRGHAAEKLRWQMVARALREQLATSTRECEARSKSSVELEGKVSILTAEHEMSQSRLAKEKERSESVAVDVAVLDQLNAQLNSVQRENLAHKRLEKEIFRSRSHDVQALTAQVDHLKSARKSEEADFKRVTDELRTRLSRTECELAALRHDRHAMESMQAHTASDLARSVDQLQRIQRRSLHASPAHVTTSSRTPLKSILRHKQSLSSNIHSIFSTPRDTPADLGDGCGLWRPTDSESPSTWVR